MAIWSSVPRSTTRSGALVLMENENLAGRLAFTTELAEQAKWKWAGPEIDGEFMAPII